MEELKLIIKDFQKAVSRLKEILELEKTMINRDSAIKRFEFCFELAWKSIKKYSAQEGVECRSPKSCFRTAFQLKLIEYDEQWMMMVDDRNAASHAYKEEAANDIYSHLPGYLKLFEKLLEKLSSGE